MIGLTQSSWNLDPLVFLDRCLSESGLRSLIECKLLIPGLGAYQSREWLKQAESTWDKLHSMERISWRTSGGICGYAAVQWRLQTCLYALLLRGAYKEIREFYQKKAHQEVPELVERLIDIVRQEDLIEIITVHNGVNYKSAPEGDTWEDREHYIEVQVSEAMEDGSTFQDEDGNPWRVDTEPRLINERLTLVYGVSECGFWHPYGVKVRLQKIISEIRRRNEKLPDPQGEPVAVWQDGGGVAEADYPSLKVFSGGILEATVPSLEPHEATFRMKDASVSKEALKLIPRAEKDKVIRVHRK